MSPEAREVLFVGAMPTADDAVQEQEGEFAALHKEVLDAAGVFEAVEEGVGGLAPRIPDGDQAGWMAAVFTSFPENETVDFVEMVSLHDKTEWQFPVFEFKSGVEPTLGPYGFADVAKDSYKSFVAVRDAGKIPLGTRFQVTLPSPMMSMVSVLGEWDDILPVAEQAMITEMEGILAAVPADDLTIQWDLAGELVGEEYLRHPDAANIPYLKRRPPATLDVAVASAARVCDKVPDDVELGIHLCYGNPDGMHVIEPHDCSVLKDYSNALAQQIDRKIDYIHLPVPIERDDDAYFAALADLKLDPGTKVYLGLIHLKDGIEGAKRRMAAASRVIDDYGVGTECGFTSVPIGRLEEMLELHCTVAAA